MKHRGLLKRLAVVSVSLLLCMAMMPLEVFAETGADPVMEQELTDGYEANVQEASEADESADALDEGTEALTEEAEDEEQSEAAYEEQSEKAADEEQNEKAADEEQNEEAADEEQSEAAAYEEQSEEASVEEITEEPVNEDEPGSFSYIDIDGEVKTAENVTEINYGTVPDNAGVRLGGEGETIWYGLNPNQFDVVYGNRIEVVGDVHLILTDVTKLTANEGIHVSSGASLHIYSQSTEPNQGKLIAVCTSGGNAAIGGNSDEGFSGEIVIAGGNITATGSKDAAAIGSGECGDMNGAITISGGEITATGGDLSAGIGSGEEGNVNGTITIHGGKIKAVGGDDAAGIGSGQEGNVNGTITIDGGEISYANGGKNAAGIGGGSEGCAASIRILGGVVNATGGDYGAGIGSGDQAKGTNNIEITDGKVNATGGKEGAGIGGGNESAVSTITIDGGEITAHGGTFAAGIGGGDRCDGGRITINGGVVDAYGGPHGTVYAFVSGSTASGAGIGGGSWGNAGSITINGGEVSGHGRHRGAGIGSGGFNDKKHSSGPYTGDDSEGYQGGVIRINGGKVLGSGNSAGDNPALAYESMEDGGAGIGSGAQSYGCLVEISGGDVTAVCSGFSKRKDAYTDVYNDLGAAIGTGYGDGHENKFESVSNGKVRIKGSPEGPVIFVTTAVLDPTSGQIVQKQEFDKCAAIGAAPDSNACEVEILGEWDYKVEKSLWNYKLTEVPYEDRYSVITGKTNVRISPCDHKSIKCEFDKEGHWSYCPACNYQIPKAAHDMPYYGHNETNHWRVCLNCDYTDKDDPELNQHVFDENGKCVCGYEKYVMRYEPGEGNGEATQEFADDYSSYVFPDAEKLGFSAPTISTGSGDMTLSFLGWKKTEEAGTKINDTRLIPSETRQFVFANMTLSAVWGMSWSDFRTAVNNAAAYGETLKLYCDVVRGKGPEDTPIDITDEVTIDLNGHTINLNKPSETAAGEAFIVNYGGKLTIDDTAGDGKIIGGYSGTGHGGAITIESEGGISNQVTLKGGTITGNNSRLGGAILVNGGRLNLAGGRITGNIAREEADFRGSGVYVKKGAAIAVSGSPVITDNGNKGLLTNNFNNVYLEEGCQFLISNDLLPNARIGFSTAVKPEEGSVVTVTSGMKNWSTDIDCFRSDDSNFYKGLDADGEIIIGTDKATVEFDGDGATGSTDSIKTLKGGSVKLPTCGFVPPEGMKFAGWTDGSKTYEPQTVFDVTGDVTLKALWSDKEDHIINVTVQPDEESKDMGTATGDKNHVNTGDDEGDRKVTIIARPGRGHRFIRWHIIFPGFYNTNTNSTRLFAASLLKAESDDVAAEYIDDIYSELAVLTASGDKDIIVQAEFEKSEVEEVILNEATLEMSEGETGQLEASVEPAGAAVDAFKWESDDPEVAEVDENGKVTAKKKGRAIITATVGEGDSIRGAACHVIVDDRCTVTFDSDGGTAIDPVVVIAGRPVERPDDPEKEGYEFIGWKLVTDGTPAEDLYNFSVMVRSDMTLKAQYEEIPKIDISGMKVELSKNSYTYDGKVKKPKVSTIGGEDIGSSNYTVKYSTESPKNVGTYTVTVTGTGKYTGVAKAEFKITPKEITPKVTLSKASYVYTGKALKPTVTVKDGSTKLAASQYTVTYSPSACKNVGKVSVKVTLKGNYKGTKTVTYKINPKGRSIKSVTPLSKALTVKWTKQATKMSTSYISGYQIYVATDSAFTKNVKKMYVEKYSTVSKKVTGLKGSTKYYVKMRTYKTVNGVKYYSPWSAVKTVTTKK